MTKQYNFDDYEVVWENEDGSLTLKPKQQRFGVYHDGAWWNVVRPDPKGLHVGGFGSFPDAEARARRLAAELNGEIQPAETLMRRTLTSLCQGNGSCPHRQKLHEQMWAYMKAGWA